MTDTAQEVVVFEDKEDKEKKNSLGSLFKRLLGNTSPKEKGEKHGQAAASANDKISSDSNKQNMKKQQDNPDEKKEGEQKIDDLISEAGDVLLTIKTNALFDLWPDELKVTPIALNITYNEFFASSYTKTLLIDDIGEILAETSGGSATLEVTNAKDAKGEKPTIFKPVATPDAQRARSIIQGLVIAKKEKIDITKLPKNEQVEKLVKLGNQEHG